MKRIELTEKQYRNHFRGLVNFYVFQKGIQFADSKEIATVVIEKAIRLFDFKKDVEFDTFLFTVSNCAIIDYYRKKAKEKRFSVVSINTNDRSEEGEVTCIDVADNSKDGLEQMIQTEDRNSLLDLLNVLSPIQKQIMICFYVKQLKYKEIELELGIDMNNIKVNLFRGREALIKAYKNRK